MTLYINIIIQIVMLIFNLNSVTITCVFTKVLVVDTCLNNKNRELAFNFITVISI